MRHRFSLIVFCLPPLLMLVAASPAMATQAHGDPEGILAHQISHLFLIVSLAFLIYWLRERNLVAQPGWRYIQYGAFFLILWSIDAFTVHLLDEQTALVTVERVSQWKMHISVPEGSPFLATLYYIIKLDHLLCVPALIFLYKGLKRLLAEESSEIPSAERP